MRRSLLAPLFTVLLILAQPGRAQASGENSLEAELHFEICDSTLKDVHEKLGIQQGNSSAKRMSITFFESDELDLLNQGVIARARVKDGKSDGELTVKLRPIDLKAIDESWYYELGFKCELDVLLDHASYACSYEKSLSPAEVERLREGRLSLPSTLSPTQRLFVEQTKGHEPEWRFTRGLGPIRSSRWKFRLTGIGPDLVLEHWMVPAKIEFIEVSFRVPEEQALAALARARRELAERDLRICTDPQSKTARALKALLR